MGPASPSPSGSLAAFLSLRAPILHHSRHGALCPLLQLGTLATAGGRGSADGHRPLPLRHMEGLSHTVRHPMEAKHTMVRAPAAGGRNGSVVSLVSPTGRVPASAWPRERRGCLGREGWGCLPHSSQKNVGRPEARSGQETRHTAAIHSGPGGAEKGACSPASAYKGWLSAPTITRPQQPKPHVAVPVCL